MLQGALQILRRHGAIAATKYAACRFVQRFIILDVTHFMVQSIEGLPEMPGREDVDCRFLSAEEVREFSQDPKCDLPAAIADRISGGYDFCFGGIVNGQLACYCWLALNSIEANNNRSTGNPLSGVAVSYPEQYAFRYKGFTHPDFRGQRLYQLVAHEAALAMHRQCGVEKILSSAEFVNFSALKSSYRSGFEYCGHMMVVVAAGQRFVRYPNMASSGVLFDQAAEVLNRDGQGGGSKSQTESPRSHPHEESVLA